MSVSVSVQVFSSPSTATIWLPKIVTSALRFHTPLQRMTSAVSVHTTIVSMKGSSPETTASRTGSLVLAAEWAMGAEPWPASLEKSARFIPHRNA